MKKYNVILLLLIIVALCSLCVCCAPGCAPEDPGPTYDKITIDKNEIVITLGESATIKAQTLTKGAQVVWESSNSAICSVENGVLTTHALGIVEITATCEGQIVSCMVEVVADTQGNMEGYTLSLNRNSVELYLNDEFVIIPTLKDINSYIQNVTFSYFSNDQDIATVDANGKVKAIDYGQTTVEVKYQNENDWISTVISISVIHRYSVEIIPFSEEVNVDDELQVNFIVYEDGKIVEFSLDEITMTLSDTTIASIQDGKIKGLDVGIATLTVSLTGVDVKGSYEFAVIPKNPEPINLSIENLKVYVGSSKDIEVSGAPWGHLSYTVSNDKFSLKGNTISAKEEGQATVTVTHLETKKTVTATIVSEIFDPCITTSEQFMDLEYAIDDVYLGADIDLSAKEWKTKLGFYHMVTNDNAKIAYLVEKLSVNLDGRGHKITVRYDHEINDNNTWVGGIFHKVDGGTRRITIKDLVVDFEAKYYGPTEASSNPASIGVMNSVLTLYAGNLDVNDSYFAVRMYADNFAKRETIVGYLNPGTMNNCIIDMAVFKNGAFESKVGTGSWTNSSVSVKNSTLIYNAGQEHINTFTDGSYYLTKADFINAWGQNQVVNQSTYTAWSVEDGKIYLNKREVSVSPAEVPYFNPCITTAEQFLSLDKASEDVYLGADIDLSAKEWKTKLGFYHMVTNDNAKIAYLVEKLSVNLDGRGHKITVRYDHEINDNNTWVGGIFHKIDGGTRRITIKNLVVDFEAKYYGPTEASSNPASIGVMNSVLTLYAANLDVKDSYFKVRMYADNFAKRETVVGYLNPGTMNNCIIDMAVYKNNIFAEGVGTGTWSAGQIIKNSTIIHNSPSSYTYVGKFVDGSYYRTKSDLISAWSENQVVNQSTYTAWSVKNNELYLGETQLGI